MLIKSSFRVTQEAFMDYDHVPLVSCLKRQCLISMIDEISKQVKFESFKKQGYFFTEAHVHCFSIDDISCLIAGYENMKKFIQQNMDKRDNWDTEFNSIEKIIGI